MPSFDRHENLNLTIYAPSYTSMAAYYYSSLLKYMQGFIRIFNVKISMFFIDASAGVNTTLPVPMPLLMASIIFF
jgi:hypothetical protein